MALFVADIEYQTEDMIVAHRATRMVLHFESDNEDSAIDDVRRWWGNRKLAMPEHFSVFCSVSLYHFKPQRVDEKGYLGWNTNFPFYTWKKDIYGKEYGERK